MVQLSSQMQSQAANEWLHRKENNFVTSVPAPPTFHCLQDRSNEKRGEKAINCVYSAANAWALYKPDTHYWLYAVDCSQVLLIFWADLRKGPLRTEAEF